MTRIRFIAGSGRSGTTWIQDSLADANALRPVFEPLHPYLTDIGRQFAHRLVSADEERPDLKAYLILACSGHGPRLWTQYRQQWRWLFPPPSRFGSRNDAGRTLRFWAKFLKEIPRMTMHGFRPEPLVKCIRANLMLPWIARHLDSHVVLIVRHPGAVVESELRSSWNASYALERFRTDKKLREITADRYGRLLSRRLAPAEALTLRWVIENQWAMESAAAGGITTIHYESLRSSTGTAWRELCSALRIDSVPERDILMRPSQQSGAGRRAIPLNQATTPRWMSGLGADQTSQVRGILDAVEFDTYTMDDPNPRPSGTTGSPTGHAGVTR